jgi:type 1 glutamine amidotransferase
MVPSIWQSKYFTILLGHDRFAYEDINLQKILLQGICWLASEKK